jgi:hypothetical protein
MIGALLLNSPFEFSKQGKKWSIFSIVHFQIWTCLAFFLSAAYTALLFGQLLDQYERPIETVEEAIAAGLKFQTRAFFIPYQKVLKNSVFWKDQRISNIIETVPNDDVKHIADPNVATIALRLLLLRDLVSAEDNQETTRAWQNKQMIKEPLMDRQYALFTRRSFEVRGTFLSPHFNKFINFNNGNDNSNKIVRYLKDLEKFFDNSSRLDVAVATRKQNNFEKNIYKFTSWLVESGIIEKLVRDVEWKLNNRLNLHTDDQSSVKIPLSLRHLKAAFALLAMGEVVSFVFFIGGYINNSKNEKQIY